MQKITLSQQKLTSKDISDLKIGDSVKVWIEGKEKFWVEVVEINNSSPKKFKGKIDSDPYLLESIKFGDSVSFDADAVQDVLKA